MPTKISFGLSQREIQNAIKQIQKYKTDLNIKCELFCKRLAEVGEVTAQARVGESPLGKYVAVSTDIKPERTGCKAILFAVGDTKTTDYGEFNMLLGIEFGAGVFYNSTENPLSGELGFGVGTYPNQKHAFEDGWYYFGEDDKWHYTHGVKATMPMFNASMEMIQNIKKIALEVFSS